MLADNGAGSLDERHLGENGPEPRRSSVSVPRIRWGDSCGRSVSDGGAASGFMKAPASTPSSALSEASPVTGKASTSGPVPAAAAEPVSDMLKRSSAATTPDTFRMA